MRKEKNIIQKYSDSTELSSSSISRMNRRRFISLSALIGIGASIPLHSCLLDNRPEITAKRDPNLLSEKEWETLIAVQESLFPHEEDAPGASDINAAGYFQWFITDPYIDPAEIRFKTKGLSRLNEESIKLYKDDFPNLSEIDQEAVLNSVSKISWGKSWMSTMLLLIFEALLTDPIYGANTDEKGWKWLDYTPGIPRPEKGKTYRDYTLNKGTKISSNDV